MAKLSTAYLQLYKNGKTFSEKKHECPSCYLARKRLVKMTLLSKDRRGRGSTFECPKCGLIITKSWNRGRW